MALLQDGVSQKGFFIIPQTLQQSTSYVLRIPGTPVQGAVYVGTLVFCQFHTPTGEWSSLDTRSLWLRSTVFRVNQLTSQPQRFGELCDSQVYSLNCTISSSHQDFL